MEPALSQTCMSLFWASARFSPWRCFAIPLTFHSLKYWKMLSVCEAEETWAEVWIGSAHLRHNAPNSLEQGVHCMAYMSNSEMRQVWKSVASGSSKDSLFICLHTITTTRNKQIFITRFHKQSTHAPLYSYQGMPVRWARKLTLMD